MTPTGGTQAKEGKPATGSTEGGQPTMQGRLGYRNFRDESSSRENRNIMDANNSRDARNKREVSNKRVTSNSKDTSNIRDTSISYCVRNVGKSRVDSSRENSSILDINSRDASNCRNVNNSSRDSYRNIGIISEIPSSIDISELGALVIAWGI
jgi:hypothetical protein